jgi:hypothetical protein
MKKPIPDTPSKLAGSFNLGYSESPEFVLNNLIRRVEMTVDPAERLMQAQRTIGALMGFTAYGQGGTGVFVHRDVFRRLSELTGMSPDALVTCAGVTNP